jgi:integrase
LTLGTLFDIYEREQVIHKSRGSRQHDVVALGLFKRTFGADRDVQTLSRRDLERFAQLRISGELAPSSRATRRNREAGGASRERRPVRLRTVQYDVKVLMAVLNWATTTRDERGVVLLERNPLKGLPIPAESSPRRAMFTAAQFTALCEQAASISPLFRLAVLVAYFTGHRIGAIRHLRWSDVDFEQGRMTWRARHDKRRREHVTPLPAALATVLQAERRQRLTIGDGWVLPNPKDPADPLPAHVAGDWMTRGLQRIGIAQGEWYGYHSIRRQFATSMKHLPLADLCALGGWKDAQTVIKCYMQPDEQTMREALESRRLVVAVVG